MGDTEIDKLIEDLHENYAPDEWDQRLAELLEQWPELRQHEHTLRAELVMLRALERTSLYKGRQLGPYRLMEKLGQGRTSEVWKAQHIVLRSTAALKIFVRNAQSEEVENAVLEEAIAVKKLQQVPAADLKYDPFNHIVRVDEVYPKQGVDGVDFIVLEFIENVANARERQAETLEEALMWAEQIAWGLSLAHSQRVFHRDLKPENILVTPGRKVVKIADFGLTTGHLPEAHPDTRQTQASKVEAVTASDVVEGLWRVGTLEYMAPEAARGTARFLDASNGDAEKLLRGIDIYGVGTILFSFLCGRAPHYVEVIGEGRREAIIRKILDDPTPVIVNPKFHVPRAVAAVLEKCMLEEPRRRYASVEEIARDLAALRRSKPTTLQRGHPIRTWLWLKRNPGFASAMTTTLALIIGIFFFVALPGYLALNKLARQAQQVKLEARQWKQKWDEQKAEADRMMIRIYQEKDRVERQAEERLKTQRVSLRELRQRIGRAKEDLAQWKDALAESVRTLEEIQEENAKMLALNHRLEEQVEQREEENESLIDAIARQESTLADQNTELAVLLDKIRKVYGIIVIVQTGKAAGSGTDDIIELAFGRYTWMLSESRTNHDPFELGQIDVFHLNVPDDISWQDRGAWKLTKRKKPGTNDPGIRESMTGGWRPIRIIICMDGRVVQDQEYRNIWVQAESPGSLMLNIGEEMSLADVPVK